MLNIAFGEETAEGQFGSALEERKIWFKLETGVAVCGRTKLASGGVMAKMVTEKDAEEIAASDIIDRKIAELGDWRGLTLAQIRAVIRKADPDVVEEVKWRGVPVWSHAGILCTGETYKATVKMTFAKGASLLDPSGLFNSILEGNTRRAIDFHEGDSVNKEALAALIRAAVALNVDKKAGKKRSGT